MVPQRILDEFLEMTRIESPSWHERQMADYCKAALEDIGFTVVEDDTGKATGSDSGNLIAFLEGNTPGHIAFCAHMDTVVPCEGIEAEMVDVVLDGENEPCKVIRSAGETILSSDDKAGVAAILEAMRSVVESGAARPDITVLFTTCEEHDLLGASALPEDAFEGGVPTFVLDADGRPGSVIIGAPYHMSVKARFKGRAAHAGVAPETGASAIEAAASAISRMPLGRLDDITTANIGLIEGGAAINIVADSCIVEGECRSLHESKVIAQRNDMDEAFRTAAEKHGCKLDIEWNLDYPGILFDEEDEIVKRLISAAKAAGLEPNLMFSGGGADANVLSLKGCCAITLGIGMTNFHSTNEYIRVCDLEDSARFVEAIVAEYSN